MHDPREHFTLASRHVSMAVDRVAAQRVRAFDSRYRGIRTHDAEILLELMEETLNLMLIHQATLQGEMIEWHRRHPDSDEQVSTFAWSPDKAQLPTFVQLLDGVQVQFPRPEP